MNDGIWCEIDTGYDDWSEKINEDDDDDEKIECSHDWKST